MNELSQVLEIYRQLHREFGEQIARQIAVEAGMPVNTRELLDQLLHQPGTFEERRAVMVGRIAALWRASGARLPDAEVASALAAMGEVARERFIDRSIADLAYLPASIEIGEEQVISHPAIVACLTLAARIGPGDTVLDVGTGCGYQAAVLARLAEQVVSVEIRPALAEATRARLSELNIDNVEVRVGDGGFGVPERAPFDAIVVAAGTAEPPPALLAQLRPGGRLVMPLGTTPAEERLVVITRNSDRGYDFCLLGAARFVPLIGMADRAGTTSSPVAALRYCYGAPITPALHIENV